MHVHRNERTALFIDGGSFSANARAVGFPVDHRRLIGAFRQEEDLVRAIYYAAPAEGERYAFVRRLLNWLTCSGFSIATKPAKADVDSPTTPQLRGCASIELTIDVLRLADNLDHLIIVSADDDLRRLIAALQRKGKRVSIVSTLQAQLTSDDLRLQVDQFIDLADIQERIERVQAVRPPTGLRSLLSVSYIAIARSMDQFRCAIAAVAGCLLCGRAHRAPRTSRCESP